MFSLLNSVIYAATPVQRPSDPTAPVAIKDLDILVGNLVSALIPFGGLALFIVIIIAGFKFITSEGDPKKVAEARSTLTLAFLGIALLALAFLILTIIADTTGNQNILHFNIYR